MKGTISYTNIFIFFTLSLYQSSLLTHLLIKPIPASSFKSTTELAALVESGEKYLVSFDSIFNVYKRRINTSTLPGFQQMKAAIEKNPIRHYENGYAYGKIAKHLEKNSNAVCIDYPESFGRMITAMSCKVELTIDEDTSALETGNFIFQKGNPFFKIINEEIIKKSESLQAKVQAEQAQTLNDISKSAGLDCTPPHPGSPMVLEYFLPVTFVLCGGLFSGGLIMVLEFGWAQYILWKNRYWFV